MENQFYHDDAEWKATIFFPHTLAFRLANPVGTSLSSDKTNQETKQSRSSSTIPCSKIFCGTYGWVLKPQANPTDKHFRYTDTDASMC